MDNEKVYEKITGIEVKIGKLETKIDQLNETLKKYNNSFDRLVNQLETHSTMILESRAKIEANNKSIQALESYKALSKKQIADLKDLQDNIILIIRIIKWLGFPAVISILYTLIQIFNDVSK